MTGIARLTFSDKLYIVAFVLLLICLDVECEFILVPIESKKLAQAINHAILSLSYSLIAATIFHIVVNVYPRKARSEEMNPFINQQLFTISELLRLCKITVLPLFNLDNKHYSKEEFCNIFSKTNFSSEEKRNKLKSINNNRLFIKKSINTLMLHNEFITDKQFSFLCKLQESLIIQNELIPYNDYSNNYNANQNEYGECIFELYEESKAIVRELLEKTENRK